MKTWRVGRPRSLALSSFVLLSIMFFKRRASFWNPSRPSFWFPNFWIGFKISEFHQQKWLILFFCCCLFFSFLFFFCSKSAEPHWLVTTTHAASISMKLPIQRFALTLPTEVIGIGINIQESHQGIEFSDSILKWSSSEAPFVTRIQGKYSPSCWARPIFDVVGWGEVQG